MSNCSWNNWAGSLYANPSSCENPTTVQQLQNLIAQNQGKTVRAAGTGHSWSPLIFSGTVPNALQLSLRGMTAPDGTNRKAYRWQKNGLDLVTYFPSAAWSDVRAALTDPSVSVPRMYLPTAGVLPSINATGFVAAGCHGTGWMQPTVSDLIYAIEFVSADGKVHSFSEEDTPNEMSAVRVNLGMLGLITQVTLKVEPMFRLRDQELALNTADVMGPNPGSSGNVDPSKLSALITGNDYVELFWFPWSGWQWLPKNQLSDGKMWVKKWNRTTDPLTPAPPQPPDWQNFFATVTMEFVAQNTPKGTAGHWMISGIEGAMWAALEGTINGIPPNGFVAEAPTVFHYQDYAFPVIDLEIAIPIPATGKNQWDFSNIVKAWYGVVNKVRSAFDNDLFPLTVCMDARFIKNSQSLLSPAYEPAGSDTHYCWIEVLSAYPKQVTDAGERDVMIADYNRLVSEVGATWINDYKGRPHWAKYWQTIPGVDVKGLYPEANRNQFNTLRSSLDPSGMFMNPFLKQLNLFGA